MIPTKNLRVFSLILGLLTLSVLLAILVVAPGEPEEGAVVEEATQGWAAERAGIQPGDLLLSWSRGSGNRGPVRSSFDLGQLEIEQAPFGMVTLRGTREGGSREWIVPPGRWGLRARPTLPEAILSLYGQGRNRIAAGDLEAGARLWHSAVEDAVRREDPLRAAWLQARLAQKLADAGRWPEADAALEEAVQRLERSQPTAAAQLLRDGIWSETLYFLRPNVGDRAEVRLRRALALEPKESLAAAWDLSFLGRIARDRGDYAAAEDLNRKAYAIQQKLASGSVLAWIIQRELARIAFRRGDLASQEKFYRKALESQKRLAPESLEIAVSLTDLGRNAAAQGDLSTAEERLQRALALMERLSPDGPEFAFTLGSLGESELYRGDLARAEEYLRRALALFEKFAPESFEFAYYFSRLGWLAEERGDLAAAEEHDGRTLHLTEKLSHGAPNTSYKSIYHLWNLAVVEMRKGNLPKADEHLQRVLESLDRITPESSDMVGVCLHRASIAIERDNLVLAEEMYNCALAIEEKQSPGGLFFSDILEGLGTVALGRGDLTKAQKLFQRALAIREKMAPGGTREGFSLNHLGQVHRRAGRLAMAAEHFCRATKVFDRGRKKIGGTTEERAAFGGKTAEPYRDCIAALINIGRSEEAFRVLERGRARSFLDLLAERDLSWTADLPPDLVRDRKQTDTEYDRTQAALGRLSPIRDQAEVDLLLVRLRELRARQEEIAAKIRQTSPRAAALQDPQPLGLAGTRAALDPGTVLLAWSIGRERSFLFVVQPAGTDPGLEVFSLPFGDQALREDVESFRRLLKRPGSERAALQARARRLYNLLVRPAEARVVRAQRILLSPDGPLHTLPFAALMLGDRYLVEWKPIHSVLSATVYAELARSRPIQQEPGKERLVAFGDPAYPPITPNASADPEVREVVRRGFALKPLPSTRKEVEGIAALYPQAQVYLGQEATEEKAKSLGPESRLVHFACHGLLDERFPLNSALALTLPEKPTEGQDNGLLQAWEIFESVRLDADLVTLSACDTALGREMGGEGLVGLTRAFQYAGARSVLASLWSISDVSTARFMQSFYGYLCSGKSKDEALRAAQIDQIRKQSHPFHWASFQLSGDWK
ncbi:MAG TPA: CHAT domain-containing protein [Thermoanaerobaculia bacterium]|jgi:CHAT domain-containing protein/Tfp pilus assembly protein PilF